MTTSRFFLLLALAAGATACATSSRPASNATMSSSRYLYRLLDTRKLGAEELTRIKKENPLIADYVTKTGMPDFLIEPGPGDIELVYYLKSVLTHFHQGTDGEWTLSELTPLPNAILDVLPPDIRAGTPTGTGDEQTGCWTTSIPGGTCRTCCTPASLRPDQVCSIQCKAGKS